MDQYVNRKYIIGALFILIALIYIVRLFHLQVIDKSYRISAEDNTKRVITEYPARGLVYDRNDELLVYNQAAYDIKVIPRQVEEFDTALFCELLKIDKAYIDNFFNKSETKRNRYRAINFIRQVSPETYAGFQEREYKFPGFFAQPRTLRKYSKPIAAHVLGYVQEVNERNLEQDEYYQLHDYIGASGLEKYYEEYLRGQKGRKVYLVDVHNKIIGPFQDGRYDEAAVVGNDLTITIDSELQVYAETLMKGFRGSLIALEPETGEILSFVSSPAYDPNLLVGRERGENFKKLSRDTLNPLYNRAVLAYQYPPGSPFKLVNGLIGLQEGSLKPYYKYTCRYGFHSGRVHVKCHRHKPTINFLEAIETSCNNYFCNVYKNMLEAPKFESIYESYTAWEHHVESFGIGKKLGIDLPEEARGILYDTAYFDRLYRKNAWKALTIISMAIGQGELGVTPMQLANLSAIMANRGYYIPPHFVKQMEGNNNIPQEYLTPVYTTVDSQYFSIIVDGMEMVVNGGTDATARGARIKDIVVCGKTGTAQNPHGADHSVFIAFAPKDDPKIAIAVYLENVGFGSTWAAPIASLMIEKYLTGQVNRKWYENRILNTNLLAGSEKKD